MGGHLNKAMQVITGFSALDTIRSIHADLCFLGVCSLDLIGGISVVDYDESVIKKAMINASDRVVALSARDKLGTVSPFRVAPITDLDNLITEKDIPEGTLTAFRELGIDVISV